MFLIDAVKYFLTTPYADIRIARAEYRELKQHCHDLKALLLKAENRLFVHTTEKDIDKKCAGCIQTMMLTPQLDFPYDTAEHRAPYLSHYYCKQFNPDKGTAGICMNFGCSHTKLNHDYFMAMEKYQKMRQRRRQFWRNTMTREK